MQQPYFVTLTGSRNNAGDFLIRHRGHGLLRHVRPDRGIVNMNAWEAFTSEQIEVINGARALILLGGPALRRDMYPAVYPLTEDLDRIKVPVTLMGAGWHAAPGTWEESRRYRFTPSTLSLLQRIERDGAGLSVRDYRSLNTLHGAGIGGAVMTGCPALYDPEKLGMPLAWQPDQPFKNIVFSLGVTFIRSRGLEEQARTLISSLKAAHSGAQFTVAFHHSIGEEALRAAYGQTLNAFAERHLAMTEWLRDEEIGYADISGGVDKLIALYDAADFHVGYRVHAHIYTASQRKPSVLITEDGRGRGLKEVLGGLVYDSWMPAKYSTRERLLAKAKLLRGKDKFDAFTGIGDDVQAALAYERAHGAPRLGQPAGRIDRHYPTMEKFLQELP